MPAYTALLSGYSWTSEPTLSPQRTPIFLTYSFPKKKNWAENLYYSYLTWEPFSEADKSAARIALKKWGDACGVHFIESRSSSAEIRFSWLDPLSSTTVAFAEFPELNTPDDYDQGDYYHRDLFAGNVRLNPDYRSELNDNASYKIFVLMHEIGHALGLKHPFHQMPYNGQLLPSSLDHTKYTVMSYDNGSSEVYPNELGPLDLKAIKSLYGGAKQDGSNLSKWSWNKSKQTLTQIGKTHNDKIHGTEAKDVIKGQDGSDKIHGYGGNDTLYGGNGNDVLSGGDGADRFVFNTPLNPASNIDKIVDFDSGDLLFLASWIFRSLPAGQLSPQFFSATGKAEDDDDRIIYNPGTGYVFYDPDGKGPIEQILFLKMHKSADPGAPSVSLASYCIFVV